MSATFLIFVQQMSIVLIISANTSTPSLSPTIEPTLNTKNPSFQPTSNSQIPTINTKIPTSQTIIPTLNSKIPTILTQEPTFNTNIPTTITTQNIEKPQFSGKNIFYFLKKGDLSAILFILIPSIIVVVFCGTICCAFIQVTRNEKIYVHSKLDATNIEMGNLNDEQKNTIIQQNLMKYTNS